MQTDLQKVKEFWEACKSTKKEINGPHLGSFFISKDGDYEIRILQLFNAKSGLHFNLLKSRFPVLCPRVWEDKPCPICEMVEALSSSTESRDKIQAKEWTAQEKFPMLVLDPEAEKYADRPRIYHAPWSVYSGVMGLLNSTKYKEYREILDFEKGRSIIITRYSEKGRVSYKVNPSPVSSPIDIDLTKFPSAVEVLTPKSYEDLEYVMHNGEYKEYKKSTSEDQEPQEPKKPSSYSKDLPSIKTKDEEDDVETQPEPLPLVPKTTIVKKETPSLNKNEMLEKLRKLQNKNK